MTLAAPGAADTFISSPLAFRALMCGPLPGFLPPLEQELFPFPEAQRGFGLFFHKGPDPGAVCFPGGFGDAIRQIKELSKVADYDLNSAPRLFSKPQGQAWICNVLHMDLYTRDDLLDSIDLRTQ
jgi:hypothetical protein